MIIRSRAIRILSVVTFLCTALSTAHARVVYVKTSGRDSYNGTSWKSPKKTVQAGINAAASGDDVWVAKGRYKELIKLKIGVGLYGGFNGSESSKTKRSWKANSTILDGKSKGSVVSVSLGTSKKTIIDGFTITNGNPGGGICCDSATLTVSNNIITNNYSTANGGGICAYNSDITIANNEITRNEAGDYDSGSGAGGGIYCRYNVPRITGNKITDNCASGYHGAWGGGIVCDTTDAATITNNYIAYNNSAGGTTGGIAAGNNAYVANNVIFSNTSSCYLAGMSAGAGSVVCNNIIAGNGTGRWENKGANGIICTDTMLVNNTIIGNVYPYPYDDFLLPQVYMYEGTPGKMVAANNVIYDGDIGIDGTGQLANNCVYKHIIANYGGDLRPSTDIQTDPMLTRNYHLQGNSPCIDAGDSSYDQQDWVDMDGTPRIQGLSVDIGVDEIPDAMPRNVSLSPDYASLNAGDKITLTLLSSDPDGYKNLNYVYLIINDKNEATNGICVRYERSSNKLCLKNDSNSKWLGGEKPGSAKTIENGSVRINCKNCSATGSGNNLTIQLAFEIRSLMSGKNCKAWMYSSDSDGHGRGWDQMGYFYIN